MRKGHAMARKKARTKKNPVKQRAGRLGAKVRWRRLLRWIEKLRELRGGTFQVEWDPSPEQWRDKLDLDSSQVIGILMLYVASWRAYKGKIPKDELDKIEGLIAQTGLQDTIRMLGGLPEAVRLSVGGRSSSVPPWLHVRWSYATLKRKLRVTNEEEKKLDAYMKRDIAEPKLTRKDLHLQYVLRALDNLRKEKKLRSIRNVQHVLQERYGIITSIRTVALDLATLRKNL